MPWAASPAAKPLARLSVIPRTFISGVTAIAPTMPVRITSTAVNAGSPPSRPEIPIATAAVTDFGAIEVITAGGAPNRRAIAIADTRAVSEPVTNAQAIGRTDRHTN